MNNLALVRAIYDEIEYKKSQGGSVRFEWVKGHAGHKGNEICDTLAHGFASQLDELVKQASPAQATQQFTVQHRAGACPWKAGLSFYMMTISKQLMLTRKFLSRLRTITSSAEP